MRARRFLAGLVALLVGAATAGVAWSPTAHAATIAVTTTDDENDGAGDCPGPDCSLREALVAAAPGDVVTLAADATYTLTLGELLVVAPGLVVIEGNGATVEQTTPGQRVIHRTSGDLTVRDLTVTGGDKTIVPPDTARGGGILVSSTGVLTVERSTIAANAAEESGGGLAAASVRLIDSLVAGNTAGGGGAGIATSNTSVVEITRSMLIGNRADGFAGALAVSSPQAGASVSIVDSSIVFNEGTSTGGVIVMDLGATVQSSTIHGNTATGPGSVGGLTVDGPLTLRYATITGNVSESAGNVWATELRPFASVIAESGGPLSCVFGITTVSAGYNAADDAGCGLTHPTDQQGLAAVGLGEAGMTQSVHRAPEPGSPLIDAVPLAACTGPEASVTGDQLGSARPQGSGCDIGAIEVEAAPTPTSTPSTSPTSTPVTDPPAAAPPAPRAVAASSQPRYTG